MNELESDVFNDILKNPGAHYKAPVEVVKDERLSTEQRDQILESWANDQESLLVAEEESMTEDTETEHAAVKLQKISNAKEMLE